MPGEVEKVAEFMGIPLRKLFKKYLGVTFRSRNPKVFGLAPATKSMKAGEEYPPDPRGTCVFLKEGRCSIHAVKPYECRIMDHNMTHEQSEALKDELIEAWTDHQEQVKTLLGRQHPRALDGIRDSVTGVITVFDHAKETPQEVIKRLSK